VATGGLQAFFQFQDYIWDQVAGVVILNSARGTVADFDIETGDLRPWTYRTRNVLACANEAIQEAFQKTFLKRKAGSKPRNRPTS
jgi:fructose-1,6-bisphosphatase/inositol monophosphatase family enzyme